MKVSYNHIPDSHTVFRDPHAADFYNFPYQDYANWHSQHPVFYWQDYKLWCFCSFADVNSILRDNRFGRQLPDQQPHTLEQAPQEALHMQDFNALERHSLLNLEPPQHTRLRRCVNHAFTHRQVQALVPEIEALAQQLLTNISTAGEAELLGSYAAPLAAGVIAKLVGAPDSAIPELLAWSHAMVRVYTLTQTRDEEIAANRAASEFDRFLRDLIANKRADLIANKRAAKGNLASANGNLASAKEKDDLLSLLLQNQQTNQSDYLSDDEIVSTIVLLLNAGHEATVHQIGNAVRILLTQTSNPGSYFEQDGHSPTTVQTATAKRTVQELMRIDTPLHLFKRCAMQPLTFQAQNNLSLELQAGEEVALLLGAANHDPLMFDSPQVFNPAREPLEHLSLGAGTHFCIGALLAQQEIGIALRTLFHNMPDLQLKQTPEFADSFHFRGLRELQVTW